MPNFNPRILTSSRDFGGAVFKGHAGMSAHDKNGLAGAVNALSAGHRDLIQR
jgi:hypothetical protein